MRFLAICTAVSALVAAPASILADENHEIIEKVMKDGLKGDDSPLAKVLDGKASASETKELAELVLTMKGTKAPVGDQGNYDKLVEEMIAAMNVVAEGETGSDALDKLDSATNCKKCHSKHKPKKN